eukprot:14081.XXX_1094584_1094718_1 [CDS] Oithona nana genome sequencing.
MLFLLELLRSSHVCHTGSSNSSSLFCALARSWNESMVFSTFFVP